MFIKSRNHLCTQTFPSILLLYSFLKKRSVHNKSQKLTKKWTNKIISATEFDDEIEIAVTSVVCKLQKRQAISLAWHKD